MCGWNFRELDFENDEIQFKIAIDEAIVGACLKFDLKFMKKVEEIVNFWIFEEYRSFRGYFNLCSSLFDHPPPFQWIFRAVLIRKTQSEPSIFKPTPFMSSLLKVCSEIFPIPHKNSFNFTIISYSTRQFPLQIQ